MMLTIPYINEHDNDSTISIPKSIRYRWRELIIEELIFENQDTV